MSDTKVPIHLAAGAIAPGEGAFVFDRLLGFFEQKLLLIAVEHKLIDQLAKKSVSANELAAAVRLPERGTRVLLLVLCSMGLVTGEGGLYRPTEMGAKYFVESSPFYLGIYAKYLTWLYDACGLLEDAIKTDKPTWEGFHHYLRQGAARPSPEQEALFNQGLDASSAFFAHAALRHVDLSGHKAILDIGGGLGRFVSMVLFRNPSMRGVVFDLPQVCPLTNARFAELGLAARGSTFAGDFTKDQWPTGHDVVSITRITSVRPRDEIRALYTKAFASLPSGGRLIICEAAVGSDPGSYGRQAGRMAVMYSLSSVGEMKTIDEYADFLTGIGFNKPDVMAVDDPAVVVSAVKP